MIKLHIPVCQYGFIEAEDCTEKEIEHSIRQFKSIMSKVTLKEWECSGIRWREVTRFEYFDKEKGEWIHGQP